MRPTLLIILFSLAQTFVSGQDTTLIKYISKFSDIRDIPFDEYYKKTFKDCGDERIWEIVKFGKQAIIPLIDKISDTSYSKIMFKDFDKLVNLRNGDIAYICLEQIVFIPLYVISGMQFDVGLPNGYNGIFFSYLSDNSNRYKFQAQLKKYFENAELKWEEDNIISRYECQRKHKIFGRYRK